MRKNNKTFRIWLILFLLWTALLLYLTVQTGTDSAKVSGSLVEFVIRILGLKGDPSIIHGWIRELAHAGTYFVEGFLLMGLLKSASVQNTIWITSIALFVFAWITELLQIPILGRAFSFLDIGLNFVGGMTGMILFWICYRIFVFQLIDDKH